MDAGLLKARELDVAPHVVEVTIGIGEATHAHVLLLVANAVCLIRAIGAVLARFGAAPSEEVADLVARAVAVVFAFVTAPLG